MFYVGVDVGTQSVRAGLFDSTGLEIKTAAVPIETYNPYPDVYEQSAKGIWDACAAVIRVVTAGITKENIRAIGFDATCSLTAVDDNLEPLSLSLTGEVDHSVILWMDHRAIDEANVINALHHPSLKTVGGKISPEMQPPKLMWLKKKLPLQWNKVKYFFDLPDFLTWKATENLSRSSCTVICKWLYKRNGIDAEGWADDFWNEIGLSDILSNGYEKIGSSVLCPGSRCGSLTLEAAYDFDLLPRTVVGASIIDAYAGALGILSCSSTSLPRDVPIENRMALVCGTSTCFIKVMNDPIYTPGVWGPYYSVMFPELWCCEAGQSATGFLIDHIIKMRSQASLLETDVHITETLNDILNKMYLEKKLPSVSYLTSDLHVYPDYHGNRSPLADPELRGVICGLTLSNDTEALAKQYLATIQSLAYSTRHILSCLTACGHKIDVLLVCGGLANNPLYIKMHADVSGLPVIVPKKQESVLLGAAILSTVAAGDFTLSEAMIKMSGAGAVVYPTVADKSFHEKKYKVFQEMIVFQKKAQNLMNKSC